ncbi:hypothetical protein PASE110613_18020 [Paenibacillus sediminis]
MRLGSWMCPAESASLQLKFSSPNPLLTPAGPRQLVCRCVNMVLSAVPAFFESLYEARIVLPGLKIVPILSGFKFIFKEKYDLVLQ